MIALISLLALAGCKKEELQGRTGSYRSFRTCSIDINQFGITKGRVVVLSRGENETYEEIWGKDADNDGHFEDIRVKTSQSESDLEKYDTSTHLENAYELTLQEFIAGVEEISEEVNCINLRDKLREAERKLERAKIRHKATATGGFVGDDFPPFYIHQKRGE